MNYRTKIILAFSFFLLLSRPLAAQEAAAAASSDTVKARSAALLGEGKALEAYALLKPAHEADAGDTGTTFMLGQAAMALNRPAEAAPLYEAILAREPNLPRVRLELGRAYAALGETQKAMDQFRAVLGSSLPPNVRENVGKFVGSMGRQKNWNARAAVGYISDTNVNAGPAASSILMFGVPFQLSDDARETRATGITALLEGGYFRELGASGLALQADAQYNRTSYTYMHTFDSDVFSASVGPALKKQAFVVSAPLMFENVRIGHARYNQAFAVAPQVTVPLSERLAASLSSVLQRKHYYVGGGLRNGSVRSISAGAKYFYRKDGFLQLSLRHARENTKVGHLDNRSSGLNLGWYAALPARSSLYLGPGFSFTRYAQAEAAFEDRRGDAQYNVVVNLSREFAAAGWSGTLGCTFTRNDSNLGMYDYNRTQVTVQFSKAF